MPQVIEIDGNVEEKQSEAVPLRAAPNKVTPPWNTTRHHTEGFLASTTAFCCTCLCSFILLGICNAAALIGIGIGIAYLDKRYCPVQVNLAPVLIAYATLTLFASVFEGRHRYNARDTTVETKRNGFFSFLQGLVGLANFGLFIYLCVLVFPIYGQVKFQAYGNDLNLYCHPTLFLSTFSFLIFSFVGFAIGIGVCCCFACVALMSH